MLASLAVYVLVSWLDGGAVVGLALRSCFDVLCTHTSLDDKGKGEVRGGLPTFAGAVLADVLVVFAILGVRSRSCSHLRKGGMCDR